MAPGSGAGLVERPRLISKLENAGTPVVLECELAEPSLFLATSRGAAARLAAAVAEKIC